MTIDEALKATPEQVAAQMGDNSDSKAPTTTTTPQTMSLDEALRATPEQIASNMSDSGSGTILDKPTQITQNFGTYNPIEPTAGNKAGDTNFAANMGDPVKAPPGKWTVVKSYNAASPQGAPGNYADNSGWGNDVWLKDENGHTIHLLHLGSVDAEPGQTIKGGGVVGSVGSSGNATGANLGVEWYDPKGNIGDFNQSPYAKYIAPPSK